MLSKDFEGISSDGGASLLRPFQPLEVPRLQVSPSPLWSIAAAPRDEMVVTASEDGSLYYLNVEDSSLSLRSTSRGISSSRILSLCWLDNDRLAVGSMGVVHVLKPFANTPHLTLRFAASNVAAWALTRVSRSLVCDGRYCRS